MKIGFTPKQVMHLTGIPYSTLNLWATKGLIQPSIARGSGSGSERIYSTLDLVALRVAFELRKSGVTTRSLERVVSFLRERGDSEQPLAGARLVVSGQDVVAVGDDDELVSVLARPGQGCLSFVVDMPRTVGKLAEIANRKDAFAYGLIEPEDGRKRPRSAAGNKQRPAKKSNAR
jgi:DNA-binding transcriptional MerR regulator